VHYGVAHPTYDIVGELTRFDERDTVFSRERLVPGSPEERAYHAAHPELVEIDRRIAAFIEGVGQGRLVVRGVRKWQIDAER
jgi:hypothetical protein